MGCGQEKKENFYAEYIGRCQIDDFTYSFDFKTDEIKNWHEGSHAMVIVTIDDTLVGKKLSFVTLEEEGIIRFTTRIVEPLSDFKRGLMALSHKEYIKISQPSGDFRLLREGRPVVLLSNGVGVAGLRGHVKRFVERQYMVTEMLHFNVDSRSNLFKEEFEGYQSQVKTFHTYYLSHRGAYYGMVNHELRMLIKRHDLDPIFYVCGSDDFVEENRRYLEDLDFSKDDIKVGGKQADSCCRD